LAQHKEEKGHSLSLTAYIVKAIAQAVDEHKIMHAVRKGNKLILFDDVDISTIVERDMEDGHKMPLTYIVRAANKKSFLEISDEIQQAKTAPLGDNLLQSRTKIFAKLPHFMRDIVWWAVRKYPNLRKEIAGTVGVTAVGMFGSGAGWATPITPMTLTLTLGGIVERLQLVEGQVASREFMCITISIDHDIIDGGPAARFVTRFGELVQEGLCLPE
jgi:pyruvate/2-oxoglutarate dehydrogenase complex dihydrolipoamide acyltransferase (E2) component